jgi:hypothetical protein
MRIAFVLAAFAALLSTLAFQNAGEPPFGFSARTAASYLEVEKKFLALPDAEQIRQAHLYLADCRSRRTRCCCPGPRRRASS